MAVHAMYDHQDARYDHMDLLTLIGCDQSMDAIALVRALIIKASTETQKSGGPRHGRRLASRTCRR
jgi:hypothetical protein